MSNPTTYEQDPPGKVTEQPNSNMSSTNDPTMSFNKDLDYLGVSARTDSETIEAIEAIAQSPESAGGDKTKIERALRVIANERNKTSTKLVEFVRGNAKDILIWCMPVLFTLLLLLLGPLACGVPIVDSIKHHLLSIFPGRHQAVPPPSNPATLDHPFRTFVEVLHANTYPILILLSTLIALPLFIFAYGPPTIVNTIKNRLIQIFTRRPQAVPQSRDFPPFDLKKPDNPVELVEHSKLFPATLYDGQDGEVFRIEDGKAVVVGYKD